MRIQDSVRHVQKHVVHWMNLILVHMQVAPTFGDAPGVMRDPKTKPALNIPDSPRVGGEQPSIQACATVTLVFCGPAQYKVRADSGMQHVFFL